MARNILYVTVFIDRLTMYMLYSNRNASVVRRVMQFAFLSNSLIYMTLALLVMVVPGKLMVGQRPSGPGSGYATVCNTQDYHATMTEKVFQRITVYFFNRETFPH